MATAEKHKARSQRSYRNTRAYFGTFERNADIKKNRMNRKSIFQEFLQDISHRTQNKGDYKGD